jgi:hypothetical protein
MRRSAKHEATVALARALGARAVVEPRIDRAMLLAREAVNLNRSPQTEARCSQRCCGARAALGTLTVRSRCGRAATISLSPDGRLLAVPDNDSNVRFGTRRHGARSRCSPASASLVAARVHRPRLARLRRPGREPPLADARRPRRAHVRAGSAPALRQALAVGADGRAGPVPVLARTGARCTTSTTCSPSRPARRPGVRRSLRPEEGKLRGRPRPDWARATPC